jgi:transposase
MSTDEWVAYDNLRQMGYEHERVSHGHREYARDGVHTNTIDGFWSHFKNSVRGTHRSISRQHMQKYLVEFEFRFNLRGSVSSAMFDRLIQAF